MVITDNCVAAYKLSDVNDASGNGKTMTNNGTCTFSSGLIGDGVNTSGTGSKYLSINDSLGVDGGALTMSCWVKFTGTQAQGGVMSCNNTTSKVLNYLYIFNSTTLRWVRSKNGVGDENLDYTVTLSSGAWHHLVYWYDGTNMKMYVDGVYRATRAASGNGTVGFTTNSTIGSNYLGTFFNGQVDAAGFWSRALTDGNVSLNQPAGGEIGTLYNGGSGMEYPFSLVSIPTPVSYWDMEGDGNDSVDGNNASSTPSTQVTGKIGQAYTFNGISDVISIPNSSNLDFTSLFTMSAWIKFDSTPGATSGYGIMGQFWDGANRSYDLRVGSRTLGVSLGNSSGGLQGNYSGGTIDTGGVWYHVAATLNTTTGYLKLYINGNTVLAQSGITVLKANTATFRIGASYVGDAKWFPGVIDEVGAWNVELTPAQIYALYNYGAGITYPFSGATSTFDSLFFGAGL